MNAPEVPSFLRYPRAGFEWRYVSDSPFSHPHCPACWHEVPTGAGEGLQPPTFVKRWEPGLDTANATAHGDIPLAMERCPYGEWVSHEDFRHLLASHEALLQAHERLHVGLRAIHEEAATHGEYNSVSGKTLLPIGYQNVCKMISVLTK